MRKLISILLIQFAGALTSLAQIPAPSGEVTAEALLSLDKLTPGTTFRIAVVVNVEHPWHINANPATAGLITTTLSIQTNDTASITGIDYPKGKEIKVSWSPEPVSLYTGRVVIFADGIVSESAVTGPLKIEARLRYQACDDKVCRPPKTIPLVIATEVVDKSQGPQPAHPEIFGTSLPPPSTLSTTDLSDNAIANLISERGLLLAFVFVFLGGLALNLTPCVYPMIAITVSYFGGQGERKLSTALAHALTYCLGLVLTYSALGLAAALTGGLFGALLQSPVVLVGIALLLVALALSMFGLYEIQPPQFLVQKAAGLSSKAGYFGVFFLGATVGVIAAPCLAPILVALLAFVGQRGDPWLGWWMFFVLASGLGLPYVVLGTFSGLLARLPKSGTWMVWVKRVFGVLMLLVAVWFVHPLIAPKSPTESSIAWQPYSAEAVANADKPVLIDFYADWCIPCHEMDKKTFPDPRIVEKSKRFLMLKVDLTRSDSPAVQQLANRFGIVGVPTYIFLAPSGREFTQLRLIGFVPADEFLTVMDQALTAKPAEAKPGLPAEVLPKF